VTLSVALRHGFSGFTLDLAFDAPPGLTALFGRSGAGKSTVVNAVAGLLRPDAGRIALDGRVLTDTEARIHVPAHRRRIGYVFQDGRLFPHLTVRQNLLYGRFFAPRDAAGPALGPIAELLGIGALLHRRPATLSGGERSRVALGRAILSAPRALLMDEPFAALDEARKVEILPYLERLRDETGLPILYVSHSLAEVARLATTTVLLSNGRVVAAGPTAAILGDPGTASVLGAHEAGGVIAVRVAGDDADGLTRLETGAGPIWLPRIDAAPGRVLHLRILAQDVMLARDAPRAISALNVLPVTLAALRPEGAAVIVQLDLDGQKLLSRVTARSSRVLGLRPGLRLHAVIKTAAIAAEGDAAPPAQAPLAQDGARG